MTISRWHRDLFFRLNPLKALPRINGAHHPYFLLTPCPTVTRSLMSVPAHSTPVNPATLFKGPIRAIWNVQGENVPTLWWPAKGVPPSDKDFWGQTQHTVLIMIPGMVVAAPTPAIVVLAQEQCLIHMPCFRVKRATC